MYDVAHLCAFRAKNAAKARHLSRMPAKWGEQWEGEANALVIRAQILYTPKKQKRKKMQAKPG